VRFFGERLPVVTQVADGGDRLVGVVGWLDDRHPGGGERFGERGGGLVAVAFVAQPLGDVVELAGLGGGDEGLDRVPVVVDYLDTFKITSVLVSPRRCWWGRGRVR
jgi:hypothetical protein